MMNFCKAITFFIFIILCAENALALYHDTLPKGINTLIYRQVFVRDLNGKFGGNNQFESYKLQVKLDSDTLKEIDSAIREGFYELYKISPQAYEKFSFGEFRGKAEAQVDVSALAYAHGITDRLTAYVMAPYYNAKVNVIFERTNKNNLKAVSDMVENSGSNSKLKNTYTALLEELGGWDVHEGTMQSVVTKTFNYNPIGTWQGQGFGDVETGIMYRPTNWKDSGLLFTTGIVLPTGEQDNPDTLQDISFGDGSYDLFFELGGGILVNYFFGIDLWVRYTNQLPKEEVIRLPEDASFPLTRRKGLAQIDLGNKLDLNFRPNLYYKDYLTLSFLYNVLIKNKDEYTSQHQDADLILEDCSDSISHSVGTSISLSTIGLFQRKSFVLPMSIKLGAQTVLMGKNTEKYNRYDLEVQFYF